jgi:hypothetical protein
VPKLYTQGRTGYTPSCPSSCFYLPKLVEEAFSEVGIVFGLPWSRTSRLSAASSWLPSPKGVGEGRHTNSETLALPRCPEGHGVRLSVGPPHHAKELSGKRREVAQYGPEMAGAPRHDEQVPHLVEPEDSR